MINNEQWRRQTPPGRMWSFYCLAGYSLLSARDAYAYLDPATGSLLIQILVGAVLGASLTAKMWWFRVKDFFARILGTSQDSTEIPHDDDN